MAVLNTIRTNFRISDFVSWQRAGTLQLNPSFQRRSVWRPGAKSYLLDTIIRGLPIPIIILRDRPSDVSTLEPLREVIDGQQRLRTLFAFLDPSLLPDFDEQRDSFAIRSAHNRELADTPFGNLPPDVQRQIVDYEFSVQVLPSDVDDRDVLKIFARLNATGVKLNFQELRNAGWYGEFKTSMYEMATEQLPRWRNWNIFSEDNIARMEEVELTSEFALFMMRGITGKSQAALDRFYDTKDEEFEERKVFEQRFRTVMDTIDDSLGDNLRYMPFRRKTLFFSLFAAVYGWRFGIDSELKATRPSAMDNSLVARIKECGDRIHSKSAPGEVLESVARRTTHPQSRSTVIEYILGSP